MGRDMQELYEISPEGEIEKELLMVAHFGCLSSEARRKLTERPGAGAYAALDAPPPPLFVPGVGPSRCRALSLRRPEPFFCELQEPHKSLLQDLFLPPGKAVRGCPAGAAQGPRSGGHFGPHAFEILLSSALPGVHAPALLEQADDVGQDRSSKLWSVAKQLGFGHGIEGGVGTSPRSFLELPPGFRGEAAEVSDHQQLLLDLPLGTYLVELLHVPAH